jgi:hypothetical protein
MKMSENNRIRYSHASKCFICGCAIVPRKGSEEGWVSLGVLMTMGDPLKYEMLCFECGEDEAAIQAATMKNKEKIKKRRGE